MNAADRAPRGEPRKRSEDPDAAELARALAGDASALARLVARSTPVIHARVGRKLLASHASRCWRPMIEDLVQEVFLDLFRNDARTLRGWDPERGLSLENFVGLVAERRACSYLRSTRGNPWREEPAKDGDFDLPSAEAGPERRRAARETLDIVLERLQSDLSPYAWQLFELLYMEERDVEEVCRILNVRRDAVYQQRHRLRQKVRDLWDSETGAPP